jgi:tRNA G18 (ribose-2'-O)-methylase SpoU
VIRVGSIDDARLALYHSIADPATLEGAGAFVAEGRLVVERLLALPHFVVRSILVTDAALAAMRGVFAARPDVPVYVVDQPVMNTIAGFNIHRGCLAIADRLPRRCLADLALGSLRRLLILEGVNNPDNVGGIFRSAAAFDIDAVVLGPACGDPLYRKAIRTSMAATLAVPYVHAATWPDALTSIAAAAFTVVALTPDEKAASIEELPPALPRVALLVGAEGAGLSSAALSVATTQARIPMPGGRADSLNVTVAASIALHYFSRRE